ncbi:MAG: DedA family protein [Candidatus Solibacter usitatus]|nr:DedA family protein [Candidatus Solibacter usitatus]
MEVIQHWIAQYGYWGISALLALGIVGLPIPDETLLAFTGYLVFRGELKLAPAALAALGGSVSGITASYILGRWAGYPLLHKYGRWVRVGDAEIKRAHDFYHRLGGLSLTFGYYIAGVRHFTAFVAGASRLEFPIFAAFAYSGALIWSATFLTLGYVLGERWKDILELVHRFGHIAGIAAVGALAVAAVVWWQRRA